MPTKQWVTMYILLNFSKVNRFDWGAICSSKDLTTSTEFIDADLKAHNSAELKS